MDVVTRPRALLTLADPAAPAPAAPALDSEALSPTDAYWRAANYLSVGQIYLYDNPLLHKPLTLGHVKPLVVGHWGTTPGQNFIYVHLNRVIKDQPHPSLPNARASDRRSTATVQRFREWPRRHAL